MNRVINFLRRMSTSIIPVLVMGCFMLLSLWLLSAATENSGQFGRMHAILIVINVLGLVLLVGLITIDIIRLYRQYKREAIGSRLAVRLMSIFVIMALVPVSIVFYFSLGFIQRGIDSWFDVRIERAMEDALTLSRSSLDSRMRDLLKQTRAMGSTLVDTPNEFAIYGLDELREKNGANELTLMNNSGRVIALSSANPTAIIPQRPDEVVLSQVRDSKSYVGLTPIDELGLHIRVAVAIEHLQPTAEPRILFALYPVDERISVLADGVESAFSKYKELVYLRDPLKQSFSFTLILVVLVTLLGAVWAAFFFAQRLVAPIRVLAIGTRAVASGNYQKQLPVTSGDELGALVESFADMTEKISAAQKEVKRSQHVAEMERTYLSAVLGRLSTGVITLDRDQTIRAVNAAAGHILDVDFDDALGKSLRQLEIEVPRIQAFIHALVEHLNRTDDDWREQIVLVDSGQHKILMCQGARLPYVEEVPEGFVVVFDDVTALIQAQRDAAWGEVARRLAHEIRNPLTPIQLSAERLRHKYLATMAPEDAEVLDRSTHTIVQQVQALKKMVKAFSEYARAPKLQLQPLSLQHLIDEVLDLYRSDDSGMVFRFDYDASVPAVEADPGRMRQLLHNLIRNAIESQAEQTVREVSVTLSSVTRQDKLYVEFQVSDKGPGIQEEMLKNLFEPYVTTKEKGSGLGLAVVKRIVEEHSGLIYAVNNKDQGASVVVRLPALQQAVNEIHPDVPSSYLDQGVR